MKVFRFKILLQQNRQFLVCEVHDYHDFIYSCEIWSYVIFGVNAMRLKQESPLMSL